MNLSGSVDHVVKLNNMRLSNKIYVRLSMCGPSTLFFIKQLTKITTNGTCNKTRALYRTVGRNFRQRLVRSNYAIPNVRTAVRDRKLTGFSFSKDWVILAS